MGARFITSNFMDTLTALMPKLAFARGILKIPIFVLLLPACLLVTSIGIAVFSSLAFVVICYYLCHDLVWHFSSEGRIQHLKHHYQKRQFKAVAKEKSKRLKISQRSDKSDMQLLVELINHEINKRKNHIDHILIAETRRRLRRCEKEMNIKNALHIYSTLVDTELDLLNDALKELYQ